MPAYNKAQLLGNLTRDPELRHTPKGMAVCDFGLAINDRVPDGQGGYRDEATFIDVTAWDKTAENTAKYLKKGDLALVDGKIKMDSWDDKETGKKRTKLKIVAQQVIFMPKGEKSERSGNQGKPQTQEAEYQEETTYRFDEKHVYLNLGLT